MKTQSRTPQGDAEAVRHGRGKFACMAAAYTLGVFNDNFFKQAALVLAVAAGHNSMQGFALAVFTLPFIVFAAPAGWMADRFAKSHVVIGAKTLELLAMLAGAAGVCYGQWWLIFTMLTIMGLQATFFSPALNGSLPEVYPDWYVPRANGILRMLVTIAILAGVALAGVALDVDGVWRGIEAGRWVVAFAVIGVSAMGLLVSLGVPRRPAANPAAAFPWLGPIHTLRDLRATRQDPLLSMTIVANVFVWFVGSAEILIINTLGLQQFHLSKTLTSLLIVSQLLGLGLGGLLIARRVDVTRWYRVLAPAAASMGVVMVVMQTVPAWGVQARVPGLFALTFLAGMAGGVMLIPIESFLQIRPAPERKGAVLAAVNFAVFSGILLSSFVGNELNKRVLPTTAFGLLGALTIIMGAWVAWVFQRWERRS